MSSLKFDWDAFWYNDSNSDKLIYFNGGVLKEQDVKRVEDDLDISFLTHI